MVGVCGKCDLAIDTSSRRKTPYLTCSGFCDSSYHSQCLGFSADVLSCLKIPGFCWYCTDCLKIKNNYDAYMKSEFNNKMSHVVNEVESMFDGIRKEILEVVGTKLDNISCNNTSTVKPLYSQALASKSMVVVKPKNNAQSNDKTKTDIMKTINPVDTNVQVSQVKRVKDGGILIGCNNPEGANNFMKLASQKLSADYRISEIKRNNPRIKIVGLAQRYSDDELLKYLVGQNDIISDNSDLKILKVWATKNNSTIFQALIEVDVAVFHSAMDRGKVFVNFDLCTVYDATDIKICYKCSGFNHGQSTCSSAKIICPKCGEDHQIKECRSVELKCINCTNAKIVNNKHAVWDALQCTIYKKKLDAFKSSIFGSK